MTGAATTSAGLGRGETDLEWLHEAVEEFFEIAVRDARLARRVMTAITSYRIGDRVDLKKLTGMENNWRIRVGDWRIILRMRESGVLVTAIDNRRDAY